MIHRLISRFAGAGFITEPLEGGYNSEVYRLRDGGDGLVVKFVGGKKQMSLQLEDAQLLGERAVRYRQLLKEIGVVVPDYLEWLLGYDSHNLLRLVLVEPYRGVSAKEFLKAGTERECVEVLHCILHAMEPLLLSESGLTRVGIDSKPENFVVCDGVYTFVDVMPPRFVDKGKYLVEYPEPKTEQGCMLGKWKHFTIEGILTVLLTQLARIRPKLYPLFKSAISDWCRGRIALELPSADGVSRQYYQSLTNPYTMRLFACDLGSRDGISPSLIEDFFQLTHFEDVLLETDIFSAQQVLKSLHESIFS